MNIENVKLLLENVYGQGQKTLTVNGKSKASKSTYYYSLPDMTEILAIRDALDPVLSRGDVSEHELVYKYPTSPRNINAAAQCAVLSTEDEPFPRPWSARWTVKFYEIVAIRFHRSFGRHIAATLILGRKPLVTLYSTDCDSLYGYWSGAYRSGRDARFQTSRGMNYWVSKNLYYNELFRAFSVAFLETAAALKREYILKDVARAIQRDGFFLPDVPYCELRRYRTPKDLILSVLPDIDGLGININALDLNLAYLIATIARVAPKSQWKYLKKPPENLVRNAFSLNALFDGLTPGIAVTAYYKSTIEDLFWEDDAETIIDDYVRLCLDNGVEVHLGYSFNQLRRAHDELSVLDRERALDPEFSTPLITTPSQFDELEPKLDAAFPGEFERMKDARRLYQEGENQHNCVFSRRFLLRCDKAAVFHWDHEGKSYTVQFGTDRNGYHCVEEIRARFNEPCPSAVQNLLDSKLGWGLFGLDQDADLPF